MNQTVLPYEILISDDCSTDGSVALIMDYMKRYPNLIKGIFNKKNCGFPVNRNSALKVVDGDYIYILDGDDQFSQNNIEVSLCFLQQNPEYSAVYSNLNFIDSNGKFLFVRDDVEQVEGEVLFDMAIGRFGILRNMLIKKHVFKEIGFLDEKLQHYDGFDLTVRIAEKFKIGYIKEVLADYRQVSNTSNSKGLKPEIHFNELARIYKKMLRLQKSFNVGQKMKFHIIWIIRLLKYYVLAKVDHCCN